MSTRFSRPRLVWAVAVTTLLACTVALADDNDPRAIEQKLALMENDPLQKSLTVEPVAKARQTLERVKNAQAAGDAPHAIELSALARTHAGLASDIIRAASIESSLAALQDRITDLQQKRRSAEALLEETISHRERAMAELRRLKDESSRAPGAVEPQKSAPMPAKASPSKPAPSKPAPSKPAPSKPGIDSPARAQPPSPTSTPIDGTQRRVPLPAKSPAAGTPSGSQVKVSP